MDTQAIAQILHDYKWKNMPLDKALKAIVPEKKEVSSGEYSIRLDKNITFDVIKHVDTDYFHQSFQIGDDFLMIQKDILIYERLYIYFGTFKKYVNIAPDHTVISFINSVLQEKQITLFKNFLSADVQMYLGKIRKI